MSTNHPDNCLDVSRLQRTVADAAQRYRDLQRRYLDTQLDLLEKVTLHELIDLNRELFDQVVEAEEALFAAVDAWESALGESS